MLTTPLIHPEILGALGAMGHGSQILISDGNYPHVTASNAEARRVYLNLSPGLINGVDVLKAIATAVPLEAAHVMQTADGSTPPIWSEFAALLPHLILEPVEKFAFYDAARSGNVGLVIATGEQRIFANLLLTIGVVMPTE